MKLRAKVDIIITIQLLKKLSTMVISALRNLVIVWIDLKSLI